MIQLLQQCAGQSVVSC